MSRIKMTQEKKLSTENFWNTKNRKKFVESRIGINYDDWQWEYAEHKGNTAARVGRQSGKSEGEANRLGIFCGEYEPPKKGLHLLITGGVERQAFELYQKLRRWIEAVIPSAIKGKPTQNKLELKSGLTIRALPAGRDGAGLRNYAAAKIAVDEAHYVEDAVFVAIEPMLLTTGGTLDLMSTTRGNHGRFREAFDENSGFKTFHFKTKEVIEDRKISSSWTEKQRDFALEFLERKRKEMTKNQFKQEFEAEFLDSLQQFFPRELIDACTEDFSPSFISRQYLGVDVARYGGDENAFVVVGLTQKDKLELTRIEVTEKVSTTDTMARIKDMNRKHNFKKIYIDDGGIGGAVLDVLLEDSEVKRKMIGINNASRSITADKSRGKKLLKEDLYGNLKRLMEQKLIKIPDNEQLRQSLMSIQFEYTDNNNFRIFGKYSHITEGLIRAAWCVKTKGLKLWIK